MPYHVRRIRRESPKSKPRRIKTLQKPNGLISPRVQKVGGEHFAIVCVDPAKHRSAWMMADYFGNVLIEPQVLQHLGASFKLAVEQIHQVQHKHDIQDLIVVVEGIGNYYLPVASWATSGVFPSSALAAAESSRTPLLVSAPSGFAASSHLG
jgi:hypothetical protein